MDESSIFKSRNRNQKEQLENQGNGVECHDASGEVPPKVRLVQGEMKDKSDPEYQKVIHVPVYQGADVYAENGCNITALQCDKGLGFSDAEQTFPNAFADEILYIRDETATSLQAGMQNYNPQTLTEFDRRRNSRDRSGQPVAFHHYPSANVAECCGTPGGYGEIAEFAFKTHRDDPQMFTGNGVDLNSRDSSGQHQLHHAREYGKSSTTMPKAPLIIQHGNITLFHSVTQQSDPLFLFDSGVDLNSTDIFGQSLLHYAAASGNTVTAEMLLDKGIDVNINGYNDCTPLHVAAGGNSLSRFEALTRDMTGTCRNATVALLLNRNADVNAEDLDGNTALHHAAVAGQVEIIRLLLDFGACWYERNKQDETFLHSAARHDRLEVLEAFIEQSTSPIEEIEHLNGDSVLLQHAYKNKIVEIVVRNKLEYVLSASDIAKFLPIEGVELNITKLLLKKNIMQSYVEPEIYGGLLHNLPYLLRDWDTERYIKLLEILLASGEFNVNSLNYNADTPMHRMIKGDIVLERVQLSYDTVIKAMQLLLKNNASVNARNRYGSTPLMLAAGNEDFVQLLLESKEETGIPVEINMQDCNGETALMIATKLRNKEVVKLLLEHGASANLHDDQGFTAYHATVHLSGVDWTNQNLENRYDILKLLLKACPSAVNAVDMNGNTVLDLAKKYVRSRPMNMVSHSGEEREISPKMIDMLKEYGGISQTMQECHFDNSDQLYDIEKCMRDELDCPGLFHHQFLRTLSPGGFNILQYITCERKHFVDIFSKEDFLKMIRNEGRRRRTSLHYAVISMSKDRLYDKEYDERCDMFKELMELGCDVNAIDSCGRTPLHYVSEEDLFRTFTEEMGANENIPDFDCNTAKELFHLRQQSKNLVEKVTGIRANRRVISKYDIGQVFTADFAKAFMTSVKFVEGRRTNESGAEISTSSYAWKIWTEGEFAFRNPASYTLTDEIEKFMEKLAEGVTLRDSRFDCKCKFVGSSFEGTKIGLPDEYDFNFVLTKFNRYCTVVDSPTAPSGFVHLKRRIPLTATSDFENLENFDEFFNSDGYLICGKVLRKFKMLVYQALLDFSHHPFEVNWSAQRSGDGISIVPNIDDFEFEDANLCLTLKLEMIRPIEGLILDEISIDIVPCIHFDSFWPEEAKFDISDGLKRVGCNLVFDRPQRKYRWVPFSDPYARISFALAESTIIKDSPFVLKAAYMVLKDMTTTGCAYILKNALLYSIEALASNIRIRKISAYDDIGAEDLDFAVRHIMLFYLKFQEQDFCPSYFMPSFSVPVGEFFKSEHMKMWTTGRACRLADLFTAGSGCRDYFVSFLDYLWFCPIGTSEEFSLPIPRPLCEHFDKESLFKTLSRIS